MSYSNNGESHYILPPVHEVVCQVRFPAILSINTTDPADFQEQIRDIFPKYSTRQEKSPQPNVPPVTNHTFISADNRWKLNLTKEFLSLSTLQYSSWSEFAAQLDRPLAEFIRIYKPANFSRVGLRYMNLVNREKLGLENCSWDELIAPAYLGPMAEGSFNPEDVLSINTNFSLKLSTSARANVKSGTIQLQQKTPEGIKKSKPMFLFDMDLFMAGETPCTLCAPALQTLHGHALPLFEDFLTDTLRNAMN
ncbi:TIGR04255 family protein [Bengtsoniella intestinalis]|uniref:TIGR04255 family protein n=1 Tax=Bengtsoniella intestinalis TaxID=3073143 RepID=UPI00391FC2FE